MLPGFGVSAEYQSIGTIAKKQWQWQEVVGLLFSPKNSQLVHILSFHSQDVHSLFIFPTGPTALDSEPRGRYIINMIYNRNRLYSRASIVLPVCRCIMFNDSYLRACMKLRIVQKIRFWHGARVWCLGQVPKHRNQWQEVEGLLFCPKTLSWCIF